MIKKIIILIFVGSLIASNSQLNIDPKDKISNTFKNPTSNFNKPNESDLNRSNILSASIQENKDNTFWISIHCTNIDPIAGFQFELPTDLELLEVVGERADSANFQFHHNKNGLILGFSMSGSTINVIKDKSNNTAIVKIKVLAKPDSSFSYQIKSILAGPKGQKLDFISNIQKLYLNNKLVNISFNE